MKFYVNRYSFSVRLFTVKSLTRLWSLKSLCLAFEIWFVYLRVYWGIEGTFYASPFQDEHLVVAWGKIEYILLVSCLGIYHFDAFNFEVVCLFQNMLRVISQVQEPVPIVEGVCLFNTENWVSHFRFFHEVVSFVTFYSKVLYSSN